MTDEREPPLGVDGDAKRVLIVDMPNQRQSWVRDAWLKAGGEVVNINRDYGKFAGYEPDFVAFDDLPKWPSFETGRLSVIDNEPIYSRLSGHWISARRQWKRKLRCKNAKTHFCSKCETMFHTGAHWNICPNCEMPVMPRPSRGWRRHLRRMKAKRK